MEGEAWGYKNFVGYYYAPLHDPLKAPKEGIENFDALKRDYDDDKY